MDSSIPIFNKPHPRLSVLDWTRHIQRLQSEARTRRFEAYELRQRANQLRNETAITTKWDKYVNDDLLRDRIFQVDSHREHQRYVRECVRDEIRALKEAKNNTELVLESLQVPLMVSSQCLSNRDQRVPPELTRDTLGEELNKEVHILENSKRVLTDVCHMGWEKLKDLTNVLCRLEREVKNKEETISLDTRVRDLGWDSSGIAFQVDPTRVPPNTMTETGYIDCIENTIKIAERLMSESKNLRETMFKSCEQVRNQLYAQCQAVEMITRRRIYDVQRARNEIEWQKYKLEENLQKVDREITQLRAAIASTVNPTKLVETRLELRTRRPVLERVDDKPNRGLNEEFERVHLSMKLLEDKLENALKTYHGMQQHLERLKKDLQYKNQALETDRHLIEIRKPIHGPNETEMQRNVGYCKMSDELVTD